MDAGAVHDTIDDAFAPDDAVTDVGAPGTVAVAADGMTAFDFAETGPAPTTFVATTVNV